MIGGFPCSFEIDVGIGNACPVGDERIDDCLPNTSRYPVTSANFPFKSTFILLVHPHH